MRMTGLRLCPFFYASVTIAVVLMLLSGCQNSNAPAALGDETLEIQPRMEEPSEEEIRSGCYVTIFLAGTIDMGNSENWQAALVETFSSSEGRYILYNPRRDTFTSTPEEMEYQVNWELDHLEKSQIIIMNILGSSNSPVTLLEMGLFMKSGKLLVACEPDYYRHANVLLTCARYNVPLYSSLKALMQEQFGLDYLGTSVKE